MDAKRLPNIYIPTFKNLRQKVVVKKTALTVLAIIFLTTLTSTVLTGYSLTEAGQKENKKLNTASVVLEAVVLAGCVGFAGYILHGKSTKI